MYTNNYQRLINIHMKEYENMDNACKPYRALNMVARKAEIPAENEPVNQNEAIDRNETINNNEVGYIKVRVYTALGALPVPGAVVTIYTKVNEKDENAIVQLITDANGNVPRIELPVIYDPTIPSEMQNYIYSTYDMRIQALGYYTVNVLDLRIFPGISTDYKVDMIPVMAGTDGTVPEQTIIIPPPPIESSIQWEVNIMSIPGFTTVVVPENITVHLGNPDEDAQNVTVNFIDYIKNVASSEVYPTWPESAIKANVYAIVSITLNRVFTEWYRSKGYNFDITNSTQFDQSYVHNRGIFDNISNIVDEIFNDYVVRQGQLQPLFTTYCDGREVQCNGLYQWGTVDLANAGYVPYDILAYYYGTDINLVTNAPVGNLEETYPGTPLKLGDAGPYVLLMQLYLNVISTNFPAIPKIYPTNGVFTPNMEEAVNAFQSAFNLPATGIIDKGTWYKIRSIYASIRKLAELASRGVLISEIPREFTEIIDEGTIVPQVQLMQYFLNVLSAFYSTIPAVDIDGILGPQTRNSIIEFQKTVELPATGIIDEQTWNTMYNSILGILAKLPPATVYLPRLIYPGTALQRGSEGPDVLIIQEYLAYISSIIPNITRVPYNEVDGEFGPITESAVRTFEKEFGLIEDGIVDEYTWNSIVEVYRLLRFGEERSLGQFPGAEVGGA